MSKNNKKKLKKKLKKKDRLCNRSMNIPDLTAADLQFCATGPIPKSYLPKQCWNWTMSNSSNWTFWTLSNWIYVQLDYIQLDRYWNWTIFKLSNWTIGHMFKISNWTYIQNVQLDIYPIDLDIYSKCPIGHIFTCKSRSFFK